MRKDIDTQETRELRREINGAIKWHSNFMALYAPRGPMVRLIVHDDFDPELFRACGCIVTQLDDEQEAQP